MMPEGRWARGTGDRIGIRVPPLPTLVALVVLVALGISGVGTVVGPTAPAAADAIGSCSATTGVIVAVDFSPWGGNVERGCDAALTTGLDAVHAAGFVTAGDVHDGPAFVCRINSQPPPAAEPCVNTPPATSYWSYWHANAGQNAWSYSQVGAATYRPLPGSVDAWTFGSTAQGGSAGEPSFPPNAVRATNTAVVAPGPSPTAAAPPPATVPAGSPSPAAAAPVAPVQRATPPAPSGPTPADPGASTTTVTVSTATPTTSLPGQSGQAGSAGSGGPSAPKIVDATPASLAHPSAGSPVALIAGAVMVAALAAVAAIVARRRRRAS